MQFISYGGSNSHPSSPLYVEKLWMRGCFSRRQPVGTPVWKIAKQLTWETAQKKSCRMRWLCLCIICLYICKGLGEPCSEDGEECIALRFCPFNEGEKQIVTSSAGILVSSDIVATQRKSNRLEWGQRAQKEPQRWPRLFLRKVFLLFTA